MVYGTLKDYVERLGMFPSYKVPEYLGKDEEFAYFKFRIPKALDLDTYVDPSGVLPEGWMLDMIELPVHTGTELLGSDETFTYYKCKVPLAFVKTPLGMGYFAPNIKFSNEMPLPNPDQEKKMDDIFEKAKTSTKVYQQYEVTLKCNECGREATEIYTSEEEAFSGLVARFCGSCGNTTMQLASYKGLWPEGKF